MTANNMPTLYVNVMDGLKSQIGKDAFLWATERPGNDPMCYAAEKFAHEVEHLIATLTPLHFAAFRIHAKQAADQGRDFPSDIAPIQAGLMAFTLTRHANWRMGGNVNPSYVEQPS